MKDLRGIGAHACVAAIRRGDWTPSELLEAHITRLQAEDSRANALVSSTFARARMIAARHDNLSPSDRLYEAMPLLGVPFAASESLAMEGAVHSSGSRFRSNRIAGEDASAIQRLVEAGAVPLGVANSSELGFWIETNNLVYGRTSSPYDTHRIAGGASGGSAALVGAGLVPFGVGVDTEGSLRVAAHSCGVYTHKPSGGAVPVTGFEPVPDGRTRRYTSVGPISRHAEDLPTLYDLMRGPDGRDRSALPIAPNASTDWDPLWKRVVVCESFGLPGIPDDPAVRLRLRSVAQRLADQGAVVEYWRAKELEQAFWIWLALLHEGYGFNMNFRNLIVPGRRAGWFRSMLQAPWSEARITHPVRAMIITELLTKGSFLRIQRLAAVGRRLRARLSTLLADDAILLVPALPVPAPKHGRTMIRPHMIAYTALFNVLELPVTTVPTMAPRAKLPTGIQVVANHGADAVSLAAAQRIAGFEQAPPLPGTRRGRSRFPFL